MLAVSLWMAACSGAFAGTLNEQTVSQFAQSWDPLTKRLMAIDMEFDPQNMAGLLPQLEQMAAADGPDSVRDTAVKQDGYIDFEGWAKTAALIIRSAHWAKDPPNAADIDRAISLINTNTEQSAGEKAAMISDLKLAFEATLKQKPDQADIDVVKSLLPLIEPIVWQETE